MKRNNKNNYLKLVAIFGFIFFLSSCEFFTGNDEGIVVEKKKSEIVKKDVPSEAFQNRKWNLMVYMSADNNLENAALEDIYEMESSKLNTDQISVFVLVDRSPSYDTSEHNWSGTRLYKIDTGRGLEDKEIISEQIECPELGLSVNTETELDMSSGYVLTKFISYLMEKFPADYTGLIMWGHGTGWRGNEFELNKGFAFDETSKTYMTLKQFATAIKNSLDGRKLDFIGFDTCFGGEIEILYELRDCVNYVTASEGLVMASGWDYTNLFNLFQRCEEKNPQNLCACSIEQFKKQYSNTNRASIVSLDMNKMKAYFDAFEDFTLSAAGFINDRNMRNSIMNLLYSSSRVTEVYTYGIEKSDVYIDVSSLIEALYKGIDYKLDNKKKVFDDMENEFFINSWASDRKKGGVGIYFSTLTVSNLLATVHPSSYIRNKTYDQIDFVNDSLGYVPSADLKGSLLDKLFYMDF